MDDDIRNWTLEEAREYLPRLRSLLSLIRRSTEISSRARANGHWKGVDEVSSGEREAEHSQDVPPTLTAQEILQELTDRGVILRDPKRGLVDFPTRHPGGRIILLCWQLGEDDVEWWHLPEDGFAGRRPLPVPPHI